MFNNVVKRVFVILLVAALFIATLTGCGLSNNIGSTSQSPSTTKKNTTKSETTTTKKVTPPTSPTTTIWEFDPANYSNSITYDNLARTPDDFEGESLVLTGRVVQVIEDTDGTTLRIATDGSYGDVLLAFIDKGLVASRILEDDKITFYGVSAGLYTYESTLGGNITVPLIGIEQVVQGSVSESGTVFNADEVAQALVIHEYHYSSSYSPWVFLIVENTSEFTLDISGALETFDNDGNILSHDDTSANAVAPGAETILTFLLDEEYASTKYEISVSETEYYEPVVQNLTYTSSPAQNKEIVTVTNNGSIPAQFVQGFALFFKDDVDVDYDSTYFTDDYSEIKPGKSITKEVDCYEAYNSMIIIFTGRGDRE